MAHMQDLSLGCCPRIRRIERSDGHIFAGHAGDAHVFASAKRRCAAGDEFYAAEKNPDPAEQPTDRACGAGSRGRRFGVVLHQWGRVLCIERQPTNGASPASILRLRSGGTIRRRASRSRSIIVPPIPLRVKIAGRASGRPVREPIGAVKSSKRETRRSNHEKTRDDGKRIVVMAASLGSGGCRRAAATTGKAPGPCKQIAQACISAGYEKDMHKTNGKGLLQRLYGPDSRWAVV